MAFKAYKDESKKNWGQDFSDSERLSLDQINTGALLRIADSLEKMEKPFAEVWREMERYKQNYYNAVARENKLLRQVAAYKGIVKKKK